MRILLALDDSKYSAGVTGALIAQFKTEGAEVRVLHAVEPYPASLARRMGSREMPDFVAARLEQRARGKELLARTAEKLRSAGFKVTTLIKEGDARSLILDHAAKWSPDLIMVGSHGWAGLPVQITHGVDGFLVHSREEAAFRMRYLLSHPRAAERVGKQGREHTGIDFLIVRHLRDYLLSMLTVLHVKLTGALILDGNKIRKVQA